MIRLGADDAREAILNGSVEEQAQKAAEAVRQAEKQKPPSEILAEEHIGQAFAYHEVGPALEAFKAALMRKNEGQTRVNTVIARVTADARTPVSAHKFLLKRDWDSTDPSVTKGSGR